MSALDHIFTGMQNSPVYNAVPPLGRGFPLPNTGYNALQLLGAPNYMDWGCYVRSAAPNARQQHALQRGETVQLLSGERGVYLGKPTSNQFGNVVSVVVRSSASNPPSARLVHIDANAAPQQLVHIPHMNCARCGGKVPSDEMTQHEQVAHGVGGAPAGGGFAPYGYQQPVPPNSAAQVGAAAAAALFMHQQQQQQQQQQPQQQRTPVNASPVQPGAGSNYSSPNVPYVFGNSPAVGAAAPAVAGASGAPAAAQQQQQQPGAQQPQQVYQAGDAELMRHLIRGKKLGEGAQGVVYQCAVRAPYKAPQLDERRHPVATDGSVVLKSIKCADAQVAHERFQLSVRLMGIKSGHLVPYFAVIYDPNERDANEANPAVRDVTRIVHVIMPFYSGGTLSDKIQKQRGKFSEQWLLSTILQLSNALNVLHTQVPAICHGDVKPDNIMLFGQDFSQVLLMDLEASSVIPPGQKTVKADNDGTFEWRAPESAARVVSTASDVWSLGVVCMVLALLPDFPALKNPDTGVEELLNMSCWNDSRLYWCVKDAVEKAGYSERTAEIMCSLLRIDPANRPTCATCSEVVMAHMEKMILSGKWG